MIGVLLAALLGLTAPRAAFTVACVRNVCTVTNLSSGANRFQWTFGDGTTSTLKAPPAHAYGATGTYAIRLVASSGNGARSTLTRSVTIDYRWFLLPKAVTLPGGGVQRFCIGIRWTDGTTELEAASQAYPECADALTHYLFVQ